MRALVADLTWRDGAFHADVAVIIDADTGRIADVLPATALDVAGGLPVERLRDRALLPGFVNAHSHAFQRLIRGRTQWRAAGSAASFWTWRAAMYDAVLALSPDDIYDVARFCFIEMLRAGFTAVGEFHYVHHSPDGQPYADRTELAARVIAAAVDAGIRIRLLHVCYATGGIGAPLAPEQRRFATPDLDAYLADVEALQQAHRAQRMVAVGVAPHSVRAVPREWIPRIHAFGESRDLPVHMHLAEQPAEVDACLAAYGMRPIELLAEAGVLDARLTAVHATHLAEHEVAWLGAARSTVCACPTTERDLGDGMLLAGELAAAGARIAIGTDSHTIIDPFEELRLVEYHDRLRRLERVVLARDRGDAWHTAPALLEIGAAAGARSLGIDAGRIDAGALADLVAVDLNHRLLAGWSGETLPALLALSAHADVVTDVWVDGTARVRERRHHAEEAATAAFRKVASR